MDDLGRGYAGEKYRTSGRTESLASFQMGTERKEVKSKTELLHGLNIHLFLIVLTVNSFPNNLSSYEYWMAS